MDEERLGKIDKFIGVTGAAHEFASSFLEAAGWNVNQALDMYLGGGGNQAQGLVQSSRAPDIGNQQSQDRLIARARKIMEEQNVDEMTAMAIAEAQGEPQTQVRAPIAQTTDRLINHTNPFGGRNISEHDLMMQRMQEQMSSLRDEMRQNVQNGGLSVAFHPPSSPLAETRDERQRGANLQDLFSPPTDLMFQGSWEDVKAHAKSSNKWILVNIQKESEFMSYVLNRDLWCNEIVKELVRASFVFFQHEDTDSEALKYKTFYNPSNFPHVAIIDPFTGELVREIELAPYQNSASDLLAAFLEVSNNFLDSNQLEGDKIRKLQEKMRQRHDDQAAGRTTSKPGALPVKVQNITPRPIQTDSSPADDTDVEMLEKMEDIEDEPPAGPSVTTVQFRFPGKKPVKRRFYKNQPIASLFTYAQHEIGLDRKFDLICYPNKSLLSLKESTIVQERLVNTTISVKIL